MARQISVENGAGFHRIELVQADDGVHVFVYERSGSGFPERDYLDDDWDMARARCAEDYAVPLKSWKTVD